VEQGAVAGGAVAHATAREIRLARHPQALEGAAAGQDRGVSAIALGGGDDGERSRLDLPGFDLGEGHLQAVPFGLVQQVHRQVDAADGLGQAGVGVGDLAPEGRTLDRRRLQALAPRKQGRRQPRGPGPDDDHVELPLRRHGRRSAAHRTVCQSCSIIHASRL
jgi:hypothetical protein